MISVILRYCTLLNFHSYFPFFALDVFSFLPIDSIDNV